MKKFLCYIALILLICTIATPPLLRKFYKGEVKEEQKVVDIYEGLACTKDYYNIQSVYQNGKATNIKFVRKAVDSNLDSNTEEFALEYKLNDVLKNSAVSTVSEYKENTQEGEIDMVSYTLLFTMANDDTMDGLGDYTMSLEAQERYYTNQGYICSVNKY